jgi:hypothetical protein
MTFMDRLKQLFINAAWIYAFWVIAHYVSPHIYVWACIPGTITGFILSPFMAPAPHCQALRWLIYQGGNTIVSMWLLLGNWFMQLLIVPYILPGKKEPEDT